MAHFIDTIPPRDMLCAMKFVAFRDHAAHERLSIEAIDIWEAGRRAVACMGASCENPLCVCDESDEDVFLWFCGKEFGNDY